MRPQYPIQSLCHTRRDAPYYLEERVCIGRDNRGREFVKHRNYYIRNESGETMCLGTNAERLRSVLHALMPGRPIEWLRVDSPADRVKVRRPGVTKWL